MSFSKLPYELQETVLASQTKPDLKRLCLVSKAFLEVARPLLYRSLKITFLSQDEERRLFEYRLEEEEEEEADAEDGSNSESFETSFTKQVSRQAALLRTFGQRSHWKSYVKEVEAIIAEDPDQLAAELIHLISSFSTLQSLKFSTGGLTTWVEKKVMEDLLGSCSRTLRSIHLDQARLKTDELHRVLRNLPHLESIALPELDLDGDSLASTTHEALALAHLERLVVLHPNRPFLHSLATFTPSLVSIHVDWNALESLDHSRLSTIQRLTLSGYPDNSDTHDIESLSRLVSVVLGACTSLRSFIVIDRARGADSSVSENLVTHRFLQHLSPNLQFLSLDVKCLDSSYLLEWISSINSTLQQIELSRFGQYTRHRLPGRRSQSRIEVTYDTVKEREIEELCGRRGIALTWIGVGNH
ncbi:hypothetical protein JCM3765_005230 [Sporobolomyces pararoseus]